MKTITHLVLLGFALISPTTYAVDESLLSEEWYLLGGVGQSHPGWGDTQERVKTTDLIIRRESPIGGVQGSGSYKYRRTFLLELPVHLLRSPDEPPMIGLSFQACWTLVSRPDLQPYFFVGGGPVYTEADIPGTSSKIKGSYGAGVGVKLNSDQGKFLLEYRYHHLSNGGIEEPNDPLNSSKLFVGIKLDL